MTHIFSVAVLQVSNGSSVKTLKTVESRERRVLGQVVGPHGPLYCILYLYHLSKDYVIV